MLNLMKANESTLNTEADELGPSNIHVDAALFKKLQQMYVNEVPGYLKDDHPPEVPPSAMNLVKAISESGGNGIPAFTLDN